MGEHLQKISIGALLFSLLLSTQARCGEEPRLELLARDSYLPGIPVLLRVELRDPDGSLHRDRWNATCLLYTSDAADE